jgi:hypothetical protein
VIVESEAAFTPSPTPITSTDVYPCLCLCLGFSQITRITPLRFTILHLSQIFLTDALTFTAYTPKSPVPPAYRLAGFAKRGERGLTISPEK